MATENPADPTGNVDNGAAREPESHLPKTQEEFDNIVEGRIARERAKFQSQLSELQDAKDKLKELEDEGKSELEKAQGKAQAAQTELKSLKDKMAQDELRAQVAKDNDVPATLITGTTLEEMESSAKQLKAFHDSSKSAVVSTEGSSNPADAGAKQSAWSGSLKAAGL